MRLLVRALLTVVPLLTASAAHAAAVTGTVSSAAAGFPLSGMVVAAYDPAGMLRGTASTDGTGLYVLALAPGEYRLLAYDPAGVYATSFDANAESFETSPVRTISASGAQISFALVKGGKVTGGVRSANGTAIPGAVVEAYNLSGTRRGFAIANNSGDYSLVLPPGDYKLVAYHLAGYFAPAFHLAARSFAEATPVRVTEAAAAAVTLVLDVAAQVSGTAIDAATQQPLASMLVYAFTPAGAQVSVTTTDATGHFRFSLPGGDYRFVAADASRAYATAYYDGSRSFERSSIIVVTAGERRDDLRIALTPGARISGRVNAPNFIVTAYNLDGTLHATTTSDAAGRYTLVVAPGEYRIAASDPSLTYAALFYGGMADFRFAQTLSVTGDVAGIDVTLPRGGRVSGTVRNSNSQVLSGITVAAYDASGALASAAITGADGRYALVVAPGTYRLLAFDPQLAYVTSYAGGAASYETTGPLAIEADAMITADLTMRRGVRVSGTVKTDKGRLLTGVEIFALDALGNRTAGATSNDGAFTIVVPPGTYRFVAVDPYRRYAPAEPSAAVDIVEGQTPPAIALTLTAVSRRRAVHH
ncbi:MAG: carboxypeptidase regulatory-like domain-containing protein [Acidobacteriota bacterium]